MEDDYKRLGVGTALSSITNVRIFGWGTQVVISCRYLEEGKEFPYELHFNDCRQLEWDVQDAEEPMADQTQLLGISLGEAKQRSPAVITANGFELTITYGGFAVHKPSSETKY